MSLEKALLERSQSSCELCGASEELKPFLVPPAEESILNTAMICQTCQTQIENPEQLAPNHWRCLNDSMWSEVPAVKILAWRQLQRLKHEGWPQDLLDMMYMDDEELALAKALPEFDENAIIHRDSNGAILEAGDTVTLVKDLNVKGANFTAKRGTAVRRISLVADNPEHIEGKVNDQRIVILTKYVKKSK